MGVNLGLVPEQLTVTLVAGGDFVTALIASEAWPVGTEIDLHLSGGTSGEVVWPATVAGTRADWDVAYTDVQTVLDDGADTAWVMYSEADGTRLVWMKGTVRAR